MARERPADDAGRCLVHVVERRRVPVVEPGFRRRLRVVGQQPDQPEIVGLVDGQQVRVGGGSRRHEIGRAQLPQQVDARPEAARGERVRIAEVVGVVGRSVDDQRRGVHGASWAGTPSRTIGASRVSRRARQ